MTAEAGAASPAGAIRADLDRTREEFHRLADGFGEADLRRASSNPGWTNGEVLFHMSFAFIILRALVPIARLWGRLPPRCSRIFAHTLEMSTPIFNIVNAAGARIGGRVYTGERLTRKFDSAYASIVRALDRTDDRAWRRGMHYPARWDALFRDYMTLEDIFRYPLAHFRFHEAQLAASPRGGPTD